MVIAATFSFKAKFSRTPTDELTYLTHRKTLSTFSSMAFHNKLTNAILIFFLWIFVGTLLEVSAECIDTPACASTSGSQETSDAVALANAVRGYNSLWCQGTNGTGSKCTIFGKSGSAAAAMCKGVKSFNCGNAADALHAITLSCTNNYKAGGKCNIKSDDGTIISIQLIHS